jgi:hypothetical protein
MYALLKNVSKGRHNGLCVILKINERCYAECIMSGMYKVEFIGSFQECQKLNLLSLEIYALQLMSLDHSFKQEEQSMAIGEDGCLKLL